jgi:hypothetical protein
MAALTVIIKTDQGGRLALVPMAPGLTHSKAENEASRMRFRDDHANYCVYTAIFQTPDQAATFVRLRNQGLPINAAMRQATPGWHDLG